MHPCLVLALLALVSASRIEEVGPVEDACPAHLFVLGRSKNANVVAYDAIRGPDGELSPSETVAAYWLLNGEKGTREELSRIERQRAYGVDVAPGSMPGTYDLTFKAQKKRHLTIRMVQGCPAAVMAIAGREGILRRMFVQSKESSMPQVEFVEFFGEDLAGGAPLYEKYVPGK